MFWLTMLILFISFYFVRIEKFHEKTIEKKWEEILNLGVNEESQNIANKIFEEIDFYKMKMQKATKNSFIYALFALLLVIVESMARLFIN